MVTRSGAQSNFQLLRWRGRRSKTDQVFSAVNGGLLVIGLMVVFYPLLYIVSSSLSSPDALLADRVWLLPVDPTFKGFRAAFEYPPIWVGYRNTLFYVSLGTVINVVLTIMIAYPLSRRDLVGRDFIMLALTLTLFFSGGLIPTYLLVRQLHLLNSFWAMVLPQAVAVWDVIITRTFFQSAIPAELLESAQMDGCSNTRFLLNIVLPLSRPIIAVIIVFYGVANWNSFFDALLYLSNSKLYPLQLVLRNILILNQEDFSAGGLSAQEMQKREFLETTWKYALIVISTAPILAIYPFVQKYFAKGVMIGSIKG